MGNSGFKLRPQARTHTSSPAPQPPTARLVPSPPLLPGSLRLRLRLSPPCVDDLRPQALAATAREAGKSARQALRRQRPSPARRRPLSSSSPALHCSSLRRAAAAARGLELLQGSKLIGFHFLKPEFFKTRKTRPEIVGLPERPAIVVGARSSSLSRPRSGGPPPEPKSLAREVAAHSSRLARERSVAASALSSARRVRRDAASSPAAVQAWCGGVAWRRGPWGQRRSGAVTGPREAGATRDLRS
ncbi:hypothetical protein PVAP13_3NG261501 [Panicum virgatum]|uniref:Uncharacterized protein n=1 Tax=Panicum virgatum TaxID=38727 RepID=A0A8T0UJB1_PANVG|nr:hypothetical protein PVAP13_3NG261501 [Panicum virgatum]